MSEETGRTAGPGPAAARPNPPPAQPSTPPAQPSRRLWCTTALAATLGLATGCTSVPSTSPFKDMELSRTPLLGKFVWRDLVTENPDAVKPFYAALFGWEFVESRALGAPYTLIKSGGLFIGGISRTRRPQPDQPVSQWLSFMSVADVDRAVERTRARALKQEGVLRDVLAGGETLEGLVQFGRNPHIRRHGHMVPLRYHGPPDRP